MMWRRIPSSPVLDPMTLLARPSNTLPPPLGAPTTRLYPYGRVALLQGLRLLGIRPGDSVLIPSFVCASVNSPFNALGIRILYYEVDDRLEPRFETAVRALDSRTKAFLGINYFGFPQDAEATRDFCEHYGLYYIEDNSHGFLSAAGSRPLGTFGDIAIFSQRKTVALPHGGALAVNRPELVAESQASLNSLQLHGKASSFRFLLRNTALNLDVLPGLDVALQRFPSARPQSATASEENDLTDYLEVNSRLANWILLRVNSDRERRIRRQSYMFWLRALNSGRSQEVLPIFGELPTGVVPLAFPARTRRRNRFVDELNKQGVGCYPWPTLPSTAPVTRLSEEVVLIPVHRYPVTYRGTRV